MIDLEREADPHLSVAHAGSGEFAFIGFLGFVGFSELAPHALGQTTLMRTLLALHLGAVLGVFPLMPYTKMAHGLYRIAAFCPRHSRYRQ